MAKDVSVIDDVEEAKIAQELAEEYIPPTKGNLQDMVDVYFESKLGRKATEEELDIWSTKFAIRKNKIKRKSYIFRKL